MNDLSWLLYFADVLPKMSMWLGFTTFLLSIMSLAMWVIAGAHARNDGPPDYVRIAEWWEKMGRNVFISSAFLAFLMMLIPEQQTFYLIAASQAGQTVVETEEAQQILDRTYAIINQHLDKLDVQ